MTAGPLRAGVQFGQGFFSGEFESAAVIFHLQRPIALVNAEADQDAPRAAVLAHVGQRLLRDADQFAADSRRQVHIFERGGEVGVDAGVAAEALDDVGQVVEQLGGTEFEGRICCIRVRRSNTCSRSISWTRSNRGARLAAFSRTRGFAPQDVHFHFHRDQRLDGAVVQFAGDAGALHRAGARTQPAQQVNVVDGGADLAKQLLRKAEFLELVAAASVEQQQVCRTIPGPC